MKKYKIKDQTIIDITLIICFLFLAIVMFIFRNPFINELQIEAGQSLTVEDILKDKDVKVELITPIDESITNKVGEHKLNLKAKGGQYSVTIKVVDTVAPTAKLKKPTLFLNDPVDPQQFIESIDDETEVKVTITNKIDVSKKGKVKVQLLLKDEGKNETKYETEGSVEKDTKGPEIKIPSIINVEKGGTIAYKKNLEVIDNRDGKIEKVDIDTSKVDLNKVGTYPVTYSAEDSLKNKTTKVVQVRVAAYDIVKVKKEADEYAKQILKKLITNRMTNKQKLDKIYEYVRSHYIYNGQHSGTIDDFYNDALTGFKTGKGDCYVVNAMARYLLETAGIETYGVDLDGTDMHHISFMVNVNDGWYHYCAFKKKSGIRIYKWTDKQMIAHYKQFGITKMPSNVPHTPKS